ncbi:hypothetical protein [Crossiella cryophila]|uniref:Uncharacterized protein n=1 Tax=Crossiella cryophila TaxID=43355 RepID=A0A7W7CDV6_9PSEU|nr:hypothetical protein [Crossiella cryophila]MBB4679377.1 hypothetical protein [Crossiella cryophila]
MNSTSSRGSFVLEGLRVGEHAHGHGHLADGREFSFVLRHGVARLVVYRADAPAVPGRAHVELTREAPVDGVAPRDRRAVGALLRSMLTAAGVPGS